MSLIDLGDYFRKRGGSIEVDITVCTFVLEGCFVHVTQPQISDLVFHFSVVHLQFNETYLIILLWLVLDRNFVWERYLF